MEVDGISLNSLLITGPDLMNDLAGVLLQFRKEKHGVLADIEKMFLQVRMSPKFRDLFRYFWFEDGNPEGDIVEYRMCVHLFGASSSPACANYALKKTAELYGHEFSSDTVNFLRDRFYMDDGLDSKADVESTVKLAREARELCARGGFNLCKFSSNSMEVLEALPEEWLAPGAKSLDTTYLDETPDRLLGAGWNRRRDCLVYQLTLKILEPTRRNMLSLLSSIYDPLGLISAVLLPGRLLLQKFCQEKLQWDELVSQEYNDLWSAWYSQLEDLRSLLIPRCYRRTVSLPLEVVELHLFADASCRAYGCTGHLVLGDINSRDSTLVYAKSRVGPSKIPTIPRMELQAAVLAAEAAEYLVSQLSYENIVVFFWTDSTIVLGYICNTTRRFHLYVTNRVQAILRVSTIEQWGHVPTDQNPADIASRGITAAEIADSTLWWQGPEFLRTGKYPERKTAEYPELIPADDPEVKREPTAVKKASVMATNTTIGSKDCADMLQLQEVEIPLHQDELLQTPDATPGDICRSVPVCLNTPLVDVRKLADDTKSEPLSVLKRLEHLSSWCRMKAATAVMIKYLCYLHLRSMGKMTHSRAELKAHLEERVAAKKSGVEIPYKSPLTVTDLHNAEKWIVREVQQEMFPAEVKILSGSPGQPASRNGDKDKKKQLKRSSRIFRLDPFIDHEGLLRVGGRLRRSSAGDTELQPYVLPSNHHVTTLIVSYHHERATHGGRGLTLAFIRASGFWICSGKGVISNLIRDCVICKRIRGRPCRQLTADLPEARVNESPPFTYVAADFFGPFYVRAPSGRATLKRWGCVFTCLAMRGIHVEITSQMSSSSFLLAFRRFNGRRGPVRSISCDNGTNLVGADSTLKKALAEMNLDEVRGDLVAENCDLIEFSFNPPYASHMNGTVERMIRSLRASLHEVLRLHGPRLTEEELSTFLIEAENVVNSRPISAVSDPDSDGFGPLTPMRLLTMKSNAVLPLPGIFSTADIYCRDRWRAVQYLADQFWFQWRREYLPSLQERKKDQTAQENLEVGDIVLLITPDGVRNQWPTGRITEASLSDDGLVRRVRIATSKGEYVRPVTQVILLLKNKDKDD